MPSTKSVEAWLRASIGSTPADLAKWAEMLRKIATEMEQEANAETELASDRWF
jgi:hypothetical protein